MITLLNKNFAPIIFKIGFLNCSFQKVKESFIKWTTPHYKSIELIEVATGLENAFEALQPMTSIPRRWLLVPSGGGWVALFDNCMRGPDPVSAVCYLSQILACRGVVVTSIPHTLSEDQGTKIGLYGAVQFELFASQKTDFLNCERSVSVAFEGGKWSFAANGPVQGFEEPTMYQKRRIVDRFTPEMLKHYCYALGIRVDDPDFYESPALLVATNDPLPNGHFALSLVQAQQQMGL